MAVETIIDAIAPEYSADASKAAFITIAEGLTSQTAFGDNRDLAVALRAAHMMAMRDKAGNPGNVAAEKEGDLSVQYSGAIGVVQSTRLDGTAYGMELNDLINGHILPASVTGMDLS